MSKFSGSLLNSVDFDQILITVDSTEERDSHVKYRIRLTLQSTEYIIYRNYKEFKNFYAALKSQFSQIDLPSFPGKFALYNKKESRRKGFDKFLKSVIQNGKAFQVLIKKQLKRLLSEFLEEMKPDKVTGTTQPKDAIVEGEQIRYSQGSPTGDVYVKLDEEDWIYYYASLIRNDIYLFPNDNLDANFSIMICCLGCDVIESDVEDVLEIHHPYEKRPILIKTHQWKEWKDALVIVSSRANSSQDYKLKSIGRLMVKIYTGQNIMLSKPVVSIVSPHVFVKVSLDNLSYQTSILPSEELVNWNQSFIL